MLDNYYIILRSIWLIVACTIFVWKYFHSPLRIPREQSYELEMEKSFQWLAVCIPITGYGLSFLIPVIFVVFLLDDMKKRSSGVRNPNPYFPAVSLSELLGITFSLGLLPMMVIGNELRFDDSQHAENAFVQVAAALGAFPLFYAMAYNRVNAWKVPHGKWRTMYIALFPLMFYAISAQIVVLSYTVDWSRQRIPVFQLCLGACIVALESYASYRARREAAVAA